MSNPSTAMRVFRGCRALLAPARSSASSAKPSKAAASSASPAKPSKAAASEKPKARAKSSASATRATPIRPSGIQKVTPVSPALAEFLNSPEASRVDAVKQIWAYIKLHGLQNPTNKREIFCDEKLKSVFDGKDKVGFLEIGKLLSSHFIKTA